MKFSDYCDKINSSFSTKFSNYEFIFKLFDSLSSSHFKSEGTSDKDYASRLYTENGRYFKNVKSSIPTPLRESKFKSFLKRNMRNDIDLCFNSYEIRSVDKDLDLLIDAIILVLKNMIDEPTGTTSYTFNKAYSELVLKKGINKPIYKEYLSKSRKKLAKVKTILFDEVNFYDIYIANNIHIINKENSHFITEEGQLKGYLATTKEFTDKYGHYVSIQANGGYGKSMFMKHLFLCDGLENYKYEKSNLIPILISVKQYHGSETKLIDMAFDSINTYVDLSRDEFLADLKKGYFLFLFDGLDEIKSHLQIEFIDELTTLTSKYEDNYYVTTARASEIMVSQFGYKKLELEGLTLERAQKMISKMPGYDDELKKSFNEDLEFSWRSYKTICENPLLLNIMFLIYKEKNKKMPVNLFEFYDNAYEVMYEKHNMIQNHRREYKTKLSKNDLKKVISEFCYLLYQEQEYEFDDRKAMQIMNSSPRLSSISVDDFLFDFNKNLNLIYLEDGKYKFIHRLFQEFFVANYLSTLPNNEYDGLIDWFEKITKQKQRYIFASRGSTILNMLYEMDKKRCLDKIIKPVLQPYIKKEYTKSNYLNYYDKVLGILVVADYQSSAIKHPLIRLICDGLRITMNFDIHDCKDEFDSQYISDYMLYEIDFPDNDDIHTCSPVLKSDIDDRTKNMSYDEKQEYIEKNICDYDATDEPIYEIPIRDIINWPERFPDLCSKLFSNEKNYFRDHYQALYDLMYKE